MADGEPNTLIWSGEHRMYWSPSGRGYTENPEAAGMWHYADAVKETRHCGPEKRIVLIARNEVPALVLAAQRREQAAIALWHRFAPDHHLEWADEQYKDEYLAAVDAVKDALKGKPVPTPAEAAR